MVMVTRSAHRKACERSNNSDVSEKNIIPPWCSSGKVYGRRAPRRDVSKWEICSTYPLRENIWEYLYENNTVKFNCSKRMKTHKLTPTKGSRDGKTALLYLLLLVFVGLMVIINNAKACERRSRGRPRLTYEDQIKRVLSDVSLWVSKKMPSTDLITKVIPRTKFMTLLGIEKSTAVNEECCHRMRYLAAELLRTEQALRSTTRLRRTLMLTSKTNSDPTIVIDSRYIEGATALKGRDTGEWGGRVALWGVVPLWRAAPPPDTVLALRKPTPSDCWPFSGSYGEIIIGLPQIQRVNYISVEHIRPDTAKSAPKHFVVYGILQNDTWVKVVDEQYESRGPAKQYFQVNKMVHLKTLVFRVLTNQGNTKYTCVYRIHVYGNDKNVHIYNKLHK